MDLLKKSFPTSDCCKTESSVSTFLPHQTETCRQKQHMELLKSTDRTKKVQTKKVDLNLECIVNCREFGAPYT